MNVTKYIKVIIFSFFITLIYTKIKAETKVAFVEMDRIMSESLVGKSVIEQLDKLDNKNKKSFLEKKKTLNLKKDKVNSQKNILSKEEYEKKVINLNNEFATFQNEANEKIEDLRTKRNNAMKKILGELQVLLSEYSKKNNLTFIIDQKNIVIGRSDLNVTKDILKLLDQKIKKIKVN